MTTKAKPATMEPFTIVSTGSPAPGQENRTSVDFVFPDGWFENVTTVHIRGSSSAFQSFDIWYDLSDIIAPPDGPVAGAKQINTISLPMQNFINAANQTWFTGFYIANPMPHTADSFTVTFSDASSR